jgi:Zn-dependent protease
MGEVFQNLNWSLMTDVLLTVIPALLCITLHELAHGYVAYRLGDPTARDMGRLTLNPIKHIDPFGLLMMVVFKFGWAKPVPVDMRRFKNPKRGMAITALAGPFANFLIALVAIFLFGALYRPFSATSAGFYVLKLIQITAYLSVVLAVFNLLPIPPLDGSKILFSLLPDRAYAKLMRYERFGFILLILLISTSAFDSPLRRAIDFVWLRFSAVAELAFSLTSRFG